MAMAWLHLWAPDALVAAYVDLDSIPLAVPDGWRFELTPPWLSMSDAEEGSEPLNHVVQELLQIIEG